MNTTPPSDPSPPLPPRPTGGFFAWIRGLDIVRGSDRWFAGVAGGIAAKAGIDPLIVRGIFVVLALLGGPGILLYLAAWLLLPDITDRIRLEDLFRGRVEGWTVVAVVVVALAGIPAFLNLFTPGVFAWSPTPWGFLGLPAWLSGTIAWLVWIAIIVCAWIWLHRVTVGRVRARRAAEGRNEADPAATTTATFTAPADSSAADSTDTAAGSAPGAPFDTSSFSTTPLPATSEDWTQRFEQKAEQWGERAGAKTERWAEQFSQRSEDWSERYVERHEARTLGTAHTIITLALALLAGGITALWTSSASDFGSTASAVPAGIVTALVAAVAVLAVSVIVAGIRGRRTGWIGFLASCGVVALVCTSILPSGTRFQPFGTMQSAGIEAPGAVMLAGNSQVDLRSFDGEASNFRSPETTLTVWQIAGNVTVTLPKDRPTIVNVYVLAGNIGEQRGEQTANVAGPFLHKQVASNLDSSSSKSEPTTISVYLLAGNARVVRSDAHGGASSADTATDHHEDELQDLSEEKKRLESDLSRLEWQLEEPGLSQSDRRDLLEERTQVQQDLSTLELEMAR